MSLDSNDKKTISLETVNKINHVDAFHPEEFLVEYTDLATNEKRKRLPVAVQIAWFHLIYPLGRIAVDVVPENNCFVAKARVYPSYKAPVDCYLSEASASRSPDPQNPSISPREWAQTAAIGVALRYAGFDLPADFTGEKWESQGSEITNETIPTAASPVSLNISTNTVESPAGATEEKYEVVSNMSFKDKVNQARTVLCPIKKYADKTLGEVLKIDPRAINWIATKYNDNAGTKEAARVLCEYAVQETDA